MQGRTPPAQHCQNFEGSGGHGDEDKSPKSFGHWTPECLRVRGFEYGICCTVRNCWRLNSKNNDAATHTTTVTWLRACFVEHFRWATEANCKLCATPCLRRVGHCVHAVHPFQSTWTPGTATTHEETTIRAQSDPRRPPGNGQNAIPQVLARFCKNALTRIRGFGQESGREHSCMESQTIFLSPCLCLIVVLLLD